MCALSGKVSGFSVHPNIHLFKINVQMKLTIYKTKDRNVYFVSSGAFFFLLKIKINVQLNKKISNIQKVALSHHFQVYWLVYLMLHEHICIPTTVKRIVVRNCIKYDG